MENKDLNQNKWKNWIDNILIYNLLIIVAGAFMFIVSIILSLNGNGKLYDLFQKLWYPLFIPALSLFFTAICSDAVVSKIKKVT